MKVLFVWIMAFAINCWAITKPMETIENYNVMLLHGAYGKDQGFCEKGETEKRNLEEASFIGHYLGDATLGAYHSEDRLTNWIAKNVFEENVHGNDNEYVHESYIYHWRTFSNPANSSVNNAIELGYRQWNDDGNYGKRRALVEEAQEVKAVAVDDSGKVHQGQVALEIIRKNPDLFRQLASRYILIGHSMGGVVSREYVQNSDYYHGDVDKIITLDSPHEGTGALNMQLNMQWSNYLDNNALEGLTTSGFAISSRHPEQSEGSSEVKV